MSETDSRLALRPDRIATLADGIFAIVMTLLVLDLKAPEGGTSHHIIADLIRQGPKFFSYLLTFGISSVFWFGHHMEFHYIVRSDRMHLWMNLFFLMAISFLPFSASLLGSNLGVPVASAFYGVHLAILGFTRYAHWRYCTDGKRLVDQSMHEDLIDEVSGTFLWVPCMYLIAAAIAFLNVPASLIIYCGLALRYLISAKQDRHLTVIQKQATAAPGNEISLREANSDDARSIIQVHYDAVHVSASAEYELSILDDWSGNVDGRVDAMKEKLETNPDGSTIIVAEARGRVVGFGEIVASNNELRAVYVSPTAARTGVGKALLNELEEKARALGVSHLWLDSSLNAAPFYLSNGYAKDSEGEHALGSGRIMKCVKMHKDLVDRGI